MTGTLDFALDWKLLAYLILTWNESSWSILKPPDHLQWETSLNLEKQPLKINPLEKNTTCLHIFCYRYVVRYKKSINDRFKHFKCSPWLQVDSSWSSCTTKLLSTHVKLRYSGGKISKRKLSQKGTGAKGYNMCYRSLCTSDEATIGCTIELKSFTQEMTKPFGIQHVHGKKG